jgi:hypothetical protein
MDILADLARTLHDEPTSDLVLQATCRAALVAVPGCVHAEITGQRGEVLASSGLRRGAGLPPELVAEALARRVRVSTPDAGHLALPLWFHDTTIGVLALTATPAFDDRATMLATALATHAALACAKALESQRLIHVQTALQTNRGIGIAIGIVMARHRVSQEAAFEVLRAASQRDNRKLRDVAEDVVRTGEVPLREVSRAGRS